MEAYHIDSDGQLRNVDDLRDLAHDLACQLYAVVNDPRVRGVLNPMEVLVVEAAAFSAHSVTCPHAVRKTDMSEGGLSMPDIPGLEDLKDILKEL